jgi:hypothetical protein
MLREVKIKLIVCVLVVGSFILFFLFILGKDLSNKQVSKIRIVKGNSLFFIDPNYRRDDSIHAYHFMISLYKGYSLVNPSEIFRIDKEIRSAISDQVITWDEICFENAKDCQAKWSELVLLAKKIE